jgi:hypothetical protein
LFFEGLGFLKVVVVLRMRKVDASAFVAKKPLPPAAVRDQTPTKLICLALMLALVTLACRIYSVW